MEDSEYLAEYFINTYRDPETPVSTNMNAVFGEFLGEQIRMDKDFDPESILRASTGEGDYDWEHLKDDFRIFLEKRLDRHHDGNLRNPNIEAEDLEEDIYYTLGYVETGIGDANEAFITSVIQFSNPENPGEYVLEVEYLDEEEGLEAINYLLENNEEEVKRIIEKGVSWKDEERVRKAYRKVAEVNPQLARELKENVNDDRFELIMGSELN